MKKYNITEVLDAPAGTKFKDNNNTMWEVKKSESRGINYLENIGNHIEMALNSITINLKFEKIQEPLTFMEIVERAKDDHNLFIKVEHELISRDVIQNIKMYESTQKYWLFGPTIDTLQSIFSSTQLARIFLEGKWYIKE